MAEDLPNFPHLVKQPGLKPLSIRRYKRGKYFQFRFVHHKEGRKGVVVASSNFAEIKRRAEDILKQIKEGDTWFTSLTREDALIYRRSLEFLEGFEAPLDQVASEWAAAKKLSSGQIGVLEAMRSHMKQHAGVTPKTFGEVCEAFLEFKQTGGGKRKLSEWYLCTLRKRLNKFVKDFATMPVAQLTAKDVREFLDRQKLALRSRSNLLEAVNIALKFAKARHHLPHDWKPFSQEDILETKVRSEEEIQTFRPKEIQDLLSHADDDEWLRVSLAIRAFAGIRTAEFLRLDWEHLDWQADAGQGHILITARNAKTRSRRLVPMLPNLKLWLPADARQRSGPMRGSSLTETDAQTLLHNREEALCLRAGVKWKHNGLRHSFISYRMATIQNENKVANEAGNSPAVIYRNYRAVVTEENARKWFSIEPGSGAQQLLKFPTAAAAKSA